MLAAAASTGTSGGPNPEQARQVLGYLRRENGWALRCGVLLCIALGRQLPSAAVRKCTAVSEDMLSTALQQLGQGPTPLGSCGADLAHLAAEACAQYPQLAVLAQARPGNAGSSCVGQVIAVYRELRRYAGLTEVMAAAISQHLTYALLNDVTQELAVQLRLACLADQQSSAQPPDASGSCRSAEADSFPTLRRKSATCSTAVPASLSSLRRELDADIDQLLVDAVASVDALPREPGCPKHDQGPTQREKTLHRAVEAVWAATAPAACSALQTGRPGEGPSTGVEAPVSTLQDQTSQLAPAAARVQALLAAAATAICVGPKSADALVMELVAWDLVRRLVEAGVELRPDSFKDWLTFESISCARVPDAHLELLRYLFVMPPRWAMYRLAFGLTPEGLFESSPRDSTTIQAGNELGSFLDRLPYDLAQSLEVVRQRG
jgi:hypothetical protein